MSFDFQAIWRSKRAYREKLAALSFTEKLRMVEAMRERTLAIRRSVEKRSASTQAGPDDRDG